MIPYNTLRLELLRKAHAPERREPWRPPQGVREEAQRALAWIADGHAGANFTDVGRRRASQLANGEAVSLETIRRMSSYLARHEVDKQGEGFSPGEPGYPSPGRVAWAAWGGDPAVGWTARILREVEGEDRALEQRNPWEIVANSALCPAREPYAVIKSDDGSLAGCHASEQDALAQLAALELNVDE